VRMSPLVAPYPAAGGSWAPPAGWSLAQFQHLCSIDLAAVMQTDIAYIDDYCRFWLADEAPNQPIRANGVTSDPANPEIGYATFSKAKAAWSVLFAAPDDIHAPPTAFPTR
jgi:hypothetical protein